MRRESTRVPNEWERVCLWAKLVRSVDVDAGGAASVDYFILKAKVIWGNWQKERWRESARESLSKWLPPPPPRPPWLPVGGKNVTRFRFRLRLVFFSSFFYSGFFFNFIFQLYSFWFFFLGFLLLVWTNFVFSKFSCCYCCTCMCVCVFCLDCDDDSCEKKKRKKGRCSKKRGRFRFFFPSASSK